MPVLEDGTVSAASQYVVNELTESMKMTHPMIGIVLSVQPSDSPDNLTSCITEDDRGWRHECSVLIVDNNSAPNLLLENVVIPPSSHSGLDNFDEDLPRGIDKDLITGEIIPANFSNIDFTDIDAEWCVVDFIGGTIDKPYIQNWWYHPRNNYDPATCGKAGSGPKTLEQVI